MFFSKKCIIFVSENKHKEIMNVLDLIKKDLQNKKDMFGRPMIDTIVVLKKDDKGYYIEYAFKEGAPHDNRCLSWYDSYQPEVYRQNGWLNDLTEDETQKRLDQIRQDREEKVGKVFRLSSFTCRFEEDEKINSLTVKKSGMSFIRMNLLFQKIMFARLGVLQKHVHGLKTGHWRIL